jgi:hypothetical protein
LSFFRNNAGANDSKKKSTPLIVTSKFYPQSVMNNSGRDIVFQLTSSIAEKLRESSAVLGRCVMNDFKKWATGSGNPADAVCGKPAV